MKINGTARIRRIATKIIGRRKISNNLAPENYWSDELIDLS